MATSKQVRLSRAVAGHKNGDVITLDADTAHRLVSAGHGAYVTDAPVEAKPTVKPKS